MFLLLLRCHVVAYRSLHIQKCTVVSAAGLRQSPDRVSANYVSTSEPHRGVFALFLHVLFLLSTSTQRQGKVSDLSKLFTHWSSFHTILTPTFNLSLALLICSKMADTQEV